MNGGRFQDAIARHYQLQKWVSELPRVNGRKSINLAGLFESWLAAVYISDQSWKVHSKSTIQTIRDWYIPILKIRLRDLFRYISQPCITINEDRYDDETDGDDTGIHLYPQEINTKNTDLRLEFVRDRDDQFIGYEILVEGGRKREELCYFSTDRNQREDHVRALVRGKSLNPAAPNIIQVSPYEVRHQKIPIDSSDVLFAKYHQLIFDLNISLVSSSTSQDSLIENIIKLSSEYKNWLHLIPSTQANLKTRALLSWNLVISPTLPPSLCSFFIHNRALHRLVVYSVS